MALYFIGTGLGGAQDITQRGINTLRKCKNIYLESYTSVAPTLVDELSQQDITVTPVGRSFMEEESNRVLAEAQQQDVAILVIGHPFAATTHVDLAAEAKRNNIPVQVIHNASIFDVVATTGLQMYKFGKTTSIPFTALSNPTDTPARVFAENQQIGAHTLFLLDLHPEKNEFLSINDALTYLKNNSIAQKFLDEKKHIVGCARLGHPNEEIIVGTVAEVMQHQFGDAPYCLIVPGTLHFVEEESLQTLATVCYSQIKTNN